MSSTALFGWLEACNPVAEQCRLVRKPLEEGNGRWEADRVSIPEAIDLVAGESESEADRPGRERTDLVGAGRWIQFKACLPCSVEVEGRDRERVERGQSRGSGNRLSSSGETEAVEHRLCRLGHGRRRQLGVDERLPRPRGHLEANDLSVELCGPCHELL